MKIITGCKDAHAVTFSFLGSLFGDLGVLFFMTTAFVRYGSDEEITGLYLWWEGDTRETGSDFGGDYKAGIYE